MLYLYLQMLRKLVNFPVSRFPSKFLMWAFFSCVRVFIEMKFLKALYLLIFNSSIYNLFQYIWHDTQKCGGLHISFLQSSLVWTLQNSFWSHLELHQSIKSSLSFGTACLLVFEFAKVISLGGMLCMAGAFFGFRSFSTVTNYDLQIFPFLPTLIKFFSFSSGEKFVHFLHIILLNILSNDVLCHSLKKCTFLHC